MPPAFNLSQDQTLQFNSCLTARKQSVVLNYSPEIEKFFLPFLLSIVCEHFVIFFEFIQLDFSRRPHLSVRYLVFKELRFVRSDKEMNFKQLKSVCQARFEKFLNFLSKRFNVSLRRH